MPPDDSVITRRDCIMIIILLYSGVARNWCVPLDVALIPALMPSAVQLIFGRKILFDDLVSYVII